MATFNIKRGDSMPPIIIAMRVAGTGTDITNPVSYWDYTKEDVDTSSGNAESNGLAKGIDHVDFVMYSTPGVITSGPSVTDPLYPQYFVTGPASLYQSAQNGNIWVLRYNWRPPHPSFNPAKGGTSLQDSPLYYQGDTAIPGTYFGEFKIYYHNTGSGTNQLLKRTFPSTPGDSLVINILPDGNDILPGQAT
jgi:hypothetical protein